MGSPAPSPAVRAERLRLALLIFGLVDEPRKDASAATEACGLLTREEWATWCESDSQDANLARACIAAEFERRDFQWTALEWIGMIAAPKPPKEPQPARADNAQAPQPPTRRTVTLPAEDVLRAACILLGWHTPAPPED